MRSLRTLKIKSKCKPAYTLLELLIAASVIVIIVSIAIPKLKIDNSVTIKLELKRLKTYCNFLVRCAIITSKTQELTLNLPENSYAFDNKTIKLDSNISFGILESIKILPNNSNKILEKFLERPSSFKNNKINFYPNGTTSAGIIFLKDKNQQYCLALSLGISQLPYIRCYEFKASRWQILG